MFFALGNGLSAEAATADAMVPGLASLLIPGLGQLLNDQVSKAILHFGVDVVIWYGGLYLVYIDPYSYRYSLLGLAHLAWSLYSGYDAYTVARERGFSLGMTQDEITLGYRF
jgi:TM2 domain-containing membrane protein YozV